MGVTATAELPALRLLRFYFADLVLEFFRGSDFSTIDTFVLTVSMKPVSPSTFLTDASLCAILD